MSKLREALGVLSSYIAETNADLEGTGSPVSEVQIPDVWFTRRDYGSLMLDGEDARQYRRCISSLIEAVGSRISAKAVESLAQKAILEALDLNQLHLDSPFASRLPQIMRELQACLEAFPKTWRISFRIGGLNADGLPFRFGRVLFQVADEHLLDHWCQFIEMIIDSGPTENKPAAKRRITEDYVRTRLRGQVIGTLEVQSVDADAARPVARAALRSTLDEMNFFSDLVYLRIPLIPVTESD